MRERGWIGLMKRSTYSKRTNLLSLIWFHAWATKCWTGQFLFFVENPEKFGSSRFISSETFAEACDAVGFAQSIQILLHDIASLQKLPGWSLQYKLIIKILRTGLTAWENQGLEKISLLFLDFHMIQVPFFFQKWSKPDQTPSQRSRFWGKTEKMKIWRLRKVIGNSPNRSSILTASVQQIWNSSSFRCITLKNDPGPCKDLGSRIFHLQWTSHWLSRFLEDTKCVLRDHSEIKRTIIINQKVHSWSKANLRCPRLTCTGCRIRSGNLRIDFLLLNLSLKIEDDWMDFVPCLDWHLTPPWGWGSSKEG